MNEFVIYIKNREHSLEVQRFLNSFGCQWHTGEDIVDAEMAYIAVSEVGSMTMGVVPLGKSDHRPRKVLRKHVDCSHMEVELYLEDAKPELAFAILGKYLIARDAESLEEVAHLIDLENMIPCISAYDRLREKGYQVDRYHWDDNGAIKIGDW